ncbi:AAA family ATPase [Amycolatopsis sp. VS8301801F10]|uniref:helix-turn-helix transcriptional regulator n=1 Tax=Amycolatopsis sp. VS8301801F10 TaxID=2652442 RepID=UPI0038FCF909
MKRIRSGRRGSRGPELGKLREAHRRAAEGRAGTVLLTGPATAGKTDLIRRFTDELSGSGSVVLRASAARTEQRVGFGVVDQLLLGLPETGAPGGIAEGRDADARGRQFCDAVLALAADRPVVVVVDDLHFADAESRHALLHLQRRTHEEPVLFLFSELSPAQENVRSFTAELSRHPGCERIRLELLSPAETARFAGPEHADELCYAATGGNPLLLAALLADRRETGAAPAPENFRCAVSACLHRVGPAAVRVACGLAILGGADRPALARLLGLSTHEVELALRMTTETGLLVDGKFRHPLVAAAVGETLVLQAGAELRLAAARVLRDTGARSRAIAEQLVAAGEAPDPWMAAALRQAAAEARLEADPSFAIACLELALRASGGIAESAAIAADLVRIQWRNNPFVAARHLRALGSAQRRGLLDDRDTGVLARCLVWQGEIAEARQLLDRWRLAADPADAGSAREIRAVRQWIRCSYPLLGVPAEESVPEQRRAGQFSRHADAVQAAEALTGALTDGHGRSPAGEAEGLLYGRPLTEDRFESHYAALLTLVYSERPAESRHWCDRLQRAAAERRSPTWQAIFAATAAEVAVRYGDPADALRHARAALQHLSLRDWGVFAGLPLSGLVLASTALGRHEEAGAALRLPVPEAMSGSRTAPLYLYARGMHYLETGRARPALADFLDCGRLMRHWRMDRPAFVPWRSGAASAWLLLGRREEARRIAEQQWGLPGVPGSGTGAASLRILALCGDPAGRPARLAGAAGPDAEIGRFALVRALREPAGRGLRPAPGDGAPAASRRKPRPRPEKPVPRNWSSLLSTAEEPVATMAALGMTNREISAKLFITVSTVEQHLTRVYRKLQVRSRAELPGRLRTADCAGDAS